MTTRRRPTVKCGPTMTKQSHADECDINKIVAHFQGTGQLTHISEIQPYYADVSDLGGYREALDNVRAAQELFAELPSKVRAEFDNDPATYLDWRSQATDEEIKALIRAQTLPEDAIPAEPPHAAPTAPEPAPDPPPPS